MKVARLALSEHESAEHGSRQAGARRVVDAVTDAIVRHRLQPGAPLAEHTLADLFGIARATVRQALMQLSRDKLVTFEAAGGARVAMPTVEEAHQMFEARRMVESQLIGQFCATVTDEQVASLRRHIAEEQAALSRTDIRGRTRLLGDFHLVVARMFGNDVLAEMLGELTARSSLISLFYQSSRSAADSSAEHAAIVDALDRRQAGEAVEAMNAHLENVELNLRLDPRAPDLGAALLEIR